MHKHVEIVAERGMSGAHLSRMLGTTLLVCMLLTSTVDADEMHPLMTSKYWAKAGVYFAALDIGLSARGSAAVPTRPVDFESETGLDDQADLFTLEFGWQFGKKWDFAFQHFRSSRGNGYELSGPIEWEDVVYEAGADIETRTAMRITRLFFSRRAWDKGPHDLRVGAGVHLLEAGASISGEAMLEDLTTEFVESVVSAKFPFPDIGVWYRYSNSDRWVFQSRVDWLSASTSDYSGGLWNVAAGVDYALTKNIGIGLAYQFFELSGSIKEDGWRGDLHSRYEGFMFSLDGYW